MYVKFVTLNVELIKFRMYIYIYVLRKRMQYFVIYMRSSSNKHNLSVSKWLDNQSSTLARPH